MGWVQEALDRGVKVKRVQHFVGKDERGKNLYSPGPYVYMYLEQPGVYYDERGNQVSEKLAEKVGFETKQHAKERLKREKMAEAMAKIDAELRAADEAPEEEREYIAERGDWKVMRLPNGKARVYDLDGSEISGVLTEQDAIDLLELTFPDTEVNIEPVNTAATGKKESK